MHVFAVVPLLAVGLALQGASGGDETHHHGVPNPAPSSLGNARSQVEIEVLCGMKLELPHYSRGTGGVIAKARVSCESNIEGVVRVTVRGSMSSVGGGACSPNQIAYGPGLRRWSGVSGTQTVRLNASKASTFYVPPLNSTKLKSNATWYASASFSVNGVSKGTAVRSRYTGPACP